MTQQNFASRSSMKVAFTTRLLGMTITLFILILTVKAELLDYKSIAWQLCLAIPLLFASLVINSKIICEDSFNQYKRFNLLINSLSIALVANTLGLLVTKYVSFGLGITYFLLFIAIYCYLFIKDLRSVKYHSEMIVLILLIILGLIPACLSI